MSDEGVSYHDVHITTEEIARTSIFDLPYGYELACTRVTGWQLTLGDQIIAGEYEGDRWLIVDVAGHVVIDSTPDSTEDCPPSTSP